jgi:hypothetical protein
MVHPWLHDVVNMANLTEAKPFRKALKNRNGAVFDRHESLKQYAKEVAQVVRKGLSRNDASCLLPN